MTSLELTHLNKIFSEEKFINKSIVFYDGECPMCISSVRFILKRDKKKKNFYFTNLRNHLKNPTSIELYQSGLMYTQSEAIARILIEIGGIYKYVGKLILLLPLAFTNKIYHFISENRNNFSKVQQNCETIPSEFRDKFILE